MTCRRFALIFLGIAWVNVAWGAGRVPGRSSDPLLTEEQQWRAEGFRLALGADRWTALGANGAPGATGFSFRLEPSYRFAENLSLGLGLRYTVLTQTLEGLNFSATARARWHASNALRLFVGAGFVSSVGVSGVSERDATFTPLSCDGHGLAAESGIEYLWIVGPAFATGPALTFDLVNIDCGPDPDFLSTDATAAAEEAPSTAGALNPDAKEAWHFAWTLGWRLQWR